jgi:membrane dipeptidase
MTESDPVVESATQPSASEALSPPTPSPRTLSRRSLLGGGAVATSAMVAAPLLNFGSYRAFAQSERSYSKRVVDLVKRSTVIDMLSPLTLASSTSEAWYGDPAKIPASFWEDLKRSGIDVLHDAKGTGFEDARAQCLFMAAAINGVIAHHGDHLIRIEKAADLDRAARSEKVGIIFGIQNSDHFGTLDDVALFHGLGQRVSQLTYNTRNLIGTGSTDRVDGGLSDFGVAIVEKMNQVGMAVDVSHCGDQTSLDAFEVSKKPVLVTHSNVRALAGGHVRCKPDAVIDAVGRAGSVFGVTGVRMFVKADEPTTVEHVLDHFDYVAKRIGIEHVGVGSDIDLYGYDDMPADDMKSLRAAYTKGKYAFREKIDVDELAHPQRMFDLADGLIRRGYSDSDVEGVLGGNFRRVLEQIWG